MRVLETNVSRRCFVSSSFVQGVGKLVLTTQRNSESPNHNSRQNELSLSCIRLNFMFFLLRRRRKHDLGVFVREQQPNEQLGTKETETSLFVNEQNTLNFCFQISVSKPVIVGRPTDVESCFGCV